MLAGLSGWDGRTLYRPIELWLKYSTLEWIQRKTVRQKKKCSYIIGPKESIFMENKSIFLTVSETSLSKVQSCLSYKQLRIWSASWYTWLTTRPQKISISWLCMYRLGFPTGQDASVGMLYFCLVSCMPLVLKPKGKKALFFLI
jgi:hypothetical protein